jgi:hypothetical protein
MSERLQGLLAGGLAEVTMDGADLEAALGQFVGNLLRGALGPGEDHRRAAAVGLEYPADHFDLVQRVGTVGELLGAVVGGRRVRRFSPDVRWLVHERARQRDDRVRHGRREQHRLPFGGDLTQDALDVREEAEVEHFVGLVEHQHRQAAELQVALLGEVEQAAGRADDDVDALLQRLDLRLVRPATVDRGDCQLAIADLEVLGRDRQVAEHLQAEFASRDDHESARDTAQLTLGIGGDALQQRHAERQRLAHAGAGLADQIVACQCQRHRQFLDGKRVFLAVFGECADDFVADSELSKCWIQVRHTRKQSLSIVNPHGVNARTSLTKSVAGPCAEVGGPTACTHIS